MNAAQLANLLRRPGIDPRQWVSLGIVNPDNDDARSVIFDEQLGPLISVMLQPSQRSVQCRVAGNFSGNGEAEWHPISAGDEVLVHIPQGDEGSWPIIFGRMSNEIDKWPTNVAGQDPRNNTFGFQRRRTPFITETSAALLFRNATTGAQFGLDEQGQFILNDGSGTRLFLTADASGFSTPDGAVAMQIIPEDKSVFLQGGAANLEVNETETKFVSTGTISFATAGGAATGHAITLEQLVAILANLLLAMGSTAMLNPAIPGTWAAPGSALAAIDAALAAALSGAVTPAPFAPSTPTPGGLTAGLAATATAVLTGLAVPTDPGGLLPGIGRPGFML